MDPKAYWVGFNLVKGIGAVRLKALLDHFGNLEIAWGAPADALLAAGLSSRIVENLTILRQAGGSRTGDGTHSAPGYSGDHLG
jgi:DNA processing protein